jgi:hypothetical protein
MDAGKVSIQKISAGGMHLSWKRCNTRRLAMEHCREMEQWFKDHGDQELHVEEWDGSEWARVSLEEVATTRVKSVHLMTGSSSVRCGAKMGSEWDLGNTTTEVRKVTCPACKPKVATTREP